MEISSASDIISAVAVAIGAVSLLFSAFQYFRGRYESKIVLTLDKVEYLAARARDPNVQTILANLDAISNLNADVQSEAVNELILNGRPDTPFAQLPRFIDDLEYFAVLCRSRSIYIDLAIAESGELVVAIFETLKPVILYHQERFPPSSMYLNFVWLVTNAKKTVGRRRWKNRYHLSARQLNRAIRIKASS